MSLDKAEIRKTYSDFESFIQKEGGKHFCGCGCDEVIELKESHFWNGIPRYIFGHAARLRQGARSYDKSLYYCVEDIAEIADVSDQTVRLWNRNNLITAEKSNGRKKLYLKEAVDLFLKTRPPREHTDASDYYSVQDLKRMGVSRSRLRSYAREGKIQEPKHFARKTCYLKSEIDLYLNEIIDIRQETVRRPRDPGSIVSALKARVSDLEDRIKILEDCLLKG